MQFNLNLAIVLSSLLACNVAAVPLAAGMKDTRDVLFEVRVNSERDTAERGSRM